MVDGIYCGTDKPQGVLRGLSGLLKRVKCHCCTGEFMTTLEKVSQNTNVYNEFTSLVAYLSGFRGLCSAAGPVSVKGGFPMNIINDMAAIP